MNIQTEPKVSSSGVFSLGDQWSPLLHLLCILFIFCTCIFIIWGLPSVKMIYTHTIVYSPKLYLPLSPREKDGFGETLKDGFWWIAYSGFGNMQKLLKDTEDVFVYYIYQLVSQLSERIPGVPAENECSIHGRILSGKTNVMHCRQLRYSCWWQTVCHSVRNALNVNAWLY